MTMCDELITKTATEWGRELLAGERLVRGRIARAIEEAAPPAPRVILTAGDVTAQVRRTAFLDAAAIARDENA